MNEDKEKTADKLKYRREIIFKVLSWGTIVWLLVWSYSLNQSGLFEWNSPTALETELNMAKKAQAAQRLDDLNKVNANVIQLRADIAAINVDVAKAEEEQKDKNRRGFGLILAAAFYAFFYPLIVWTVYKRTDPGKEIPKDDLFSLKEAMSYAIYMGISTLVIALLIAVF